MILEVKRVMEKKNRQRKLKKSKRWRRTMEEMRRLAKNKCKKSVKI